MYLVWIVGKLAPSSSFQQISLYDLGGDGFSLLPYFLYTCGAGVTGDGHAPSWSFFPGII